MLVEVHDPPHPRQGSVRQYRPGRCLHGVVASTRSVRPNSSQSTKSDDRRPIPQAGASHRASWRLEKTLNSGMACIWRQRWFSSARPEYHGHILVACRQAAGLIYRNSSSFGDLRHSPAFSSAQWLMSRPAGFGGQMGSVQRRPARNEQISSTCSRSGHRPVARPQRSEILPYHARKVPTFQSG